MENRLKTPSSQPEPAPPADDYYEIFTTIGCYYVELQVAQQVAEVVVRRRPPRWICFTDLFGATVRLRTRTIRAICESGVGQRRNEEQFWRARKQEKKDGRNPWDDDSDWL